MNEYLLGFRPNRSTVDNIFILRQIYEKCYEYNIELHNIFIDFMQAFDSVNRNIIPTCLKKINVPNKLIRLIKMTLQNTTAVVKGNNDFSQNFAINRGVKQGDPLSATLFSIVMDEIIQKLEIRGNISTRLRQICAYADDIVITTRTKQSMVDSLVKLKQQAMKYGLIVNEKKTK